MAVKLNEGQTLAVNAMRDFVMRGEELFFALKGPAGYGKTFCVRELIPLIRGRMVFTAPTNKATKVLRESVTSEDYRPDCRTIYSLLGLRLEANGEVKELTVPDDDVDLSRFTAVVVDEASMINSTVMRYIRDAAKCYKIPFIFMGDEAQLPPVGEIRSPVWDITRGAELVEPMRHDNQILTLATAIRAKQGHPAPMVKILSDNSEGEGVWTLSGRDMQSEILAAARLGRFQVPGDAKAIAWRNVTVDQINKLIRDEIFDKPKVQWLETDRIVMLEPARDLDGDQIAHTDDEGTITRVAVHPHPMEEDYICYALSVTFDDNRTETIWTLHESSEQAYNIRVNELVEMARANGRYWKNFWGFKENFHKARHSYALTAHRSQGSTYNSVYVAAKDILENRNRREAFQCLYVAITRARKQLYTT